MRVFFIRATSSSSSETVVAPRETDRGDASVQRAIVRDARGDGDGDARARGGVA